MSSLFEGDDTITLTKTEAFRILAALMDSLELIDRAKPSVRHLLAASPRRNRTAR